VWSRKKKGKKEERKEKRVRRDWPSPLNSQYPLPLLDLPAVPPIHHREPPLPPQPLPCTVRSLHAFAPLLDIQKLCSALSDPLLLPPPSRSTVPQLTGGCKFMAMAGQLPNHSYIKKNPGSPESQHASSLRRCLESHDQKTKVLKS